MTCSEKSTASGYVCRMPRKHCDSITKSSDWIIGTSQIDSHPPKNCESSRLVRLPPTTLTSGLDGSGRNSGNRLEATEYSSRDRSSQFAGSRESNLNPHAHPRILI